MKLLIRSQVEWCRRLILGFLRNFLLLFTRDVITYLCGKLIHVSKMSPGIGAYIACHLIDASPFPEKDVDLLPVLDTESFDFEVSFLMSIIYLENTSAIW